jgi:hypothetical protein
MTCHQNPDPDHHTNLPVLSHSLLTDSHDRHIGIILDKDNHCAVYIGMGKRGV